MDSCTAVVTVIDNQAPQIWCVTETVVYAHADACGFAADSTEFDPKVTDNCQVQLWNSYNNSPTLKEELLPAGSHTIMWYAQDAGGNLDSCMFKLTVLDTIAPQIVCPADTIIGISSDLDSAWINIAIPMVIDNCDEYLLKNDFTGTEDASGIYPVGNTIVTYMASDSSGNTDTCSFVVTIENNPVGIDDLDRDNFNVNLFPNPTKGIVNVEIESNQLHDVEIIVRSINGQEVLRRTYRSTDKLDFDLSDHVSGTYLIQIDTGDKHVVKKLILDRK
jgi:hypothetical protein